MLGYTFKVQAVFKTKKHNNFEYFDQIILMQTRKLKLIYIQASVSIIYVASFTQGKEITTKEEILMNLFLRKQCYVIKNKQTRFLEKFSLKLIEQYLF